MRAKREAKRDQAGYFLATSNKHQMLNGEAISVGLVGIFGQVVGNRIQHTGLERVEVGLEFPVERAIEAARNPIIQARQSS